MKQVIVIITFLALLSSCNFSVTETEGYKLDESTVRRVDVHKNALGVYPTFETVGNTVADFLPEDSQILTLVEGDYNYDGLTDQVAIIQNEGYKILIVLFKNNTNEYKYTLTEKCDLTTPYYVNYELTTNGNSFTVAKSSFNTDLCYYIKNYTFSYNMIGFYLTNVKIEMFPTDSTNSVTNQFSWMGGNVVTDITENYYLTNKLDKYFGIDFNKTVERVNSNIGQKPHITLTNFDPNKIYYYKATKPEQMAQNSFYLDEVALNNGGDVVTYGDYFYYVINNIAIDGRENLGALYRMKNDGTEKTMLLSFGSDKEEPRIFIKDEYLFLSCANFDYPNNKQTSVYKISLNGYETHSISKGHIFNYDYNTNLLYIVKDTGDKKTVVSMDKNGKNQTQLLSTEGEVIDITNDAIYYSERYTDNDKTKIILKKMSLDENTVTDIFVKETSDIKENSLIIADLLDLSKHIVFTVGHYMEDGQFYGNVYNVEKSTNRLIEVSPESDDELVYNELFHKILYKKAENEGFFTYKYITEDFSVNEQFSVKDDILLFSGNLKIYVQKSEDGIHDSVYVRNIDNKTSPVLLFSSSQLNNILSEDSFLEYNNVEITDNFAYFQIYEKSLDESTNDTKTVSTFYIRIKLDGTDLDVLNYDNFSF